MNNGPEDRGDQRQTISPAAPPLATSFKNVDEAATSTQVALDTNQPSLMPSMFYSKVHHHGGNSGSDQEQCCVIMEEDGDAGVSPDKKFAELYKQGMNQVDLTPMMKDQQETELVRCSFTYKNQVGVGFLETSQFSHIVKPSNQVAVEEPGGG